MYYFIWRWKTRRHVAMVTSLNSLTHSNTLGQCSLTVYVVNTTFFLNGRSRCDIRRNVCIRHPTAGRIQHPSAWYLRRHICIRMWLIAKRWPMCEIAVKASGLSTNIVVCVAPLHVKGRSGTQCCRLPSYHSFTGKLGFLEEAEKWLYFTRS